MKKISLIAFIIFVVDQIVKFVITSNIALDEAINIIDSFFNITYVRNYGAAFSILEGGRVFLILVAFFTLFLIYQMFIKNSKLTKLETVSFGLLIGGIIGNLTDRIIHGYVIDFLEFKLFNYNFPIFNIADIFIVSSMFLIVITMLGDKNDKVNSK